MDQFTFNTTPSIRQGWGAASNLGDVVSSLNLPLASASILFVTDPGIMKLGLADAAIAHLKTAGHSVVLFDRIEPDPKATTVLEAVDIAKSNTVSSVIGFGGGSSMDVAKMIALLAHSDQPLDEMYGVNQVTGARLPLILVPTTAGTGSEVTAVSILTTGTAEKKGVVSPVLLPDIALLDAELTMGLPAHITAACPNAVPNMQHSPHMSSRIST